MGRYTLDVAGMQCAGCENIIQSTLSEMDDVDSVDADYRSGTVEVTVDDDQKSAVIEQLGTIGYDVTGQ